MPDILKPGPRVWKGVLLMWRHPYLIEWLNKDHEDWGVQSAQLKEWGIKQVDIDNLLRAVDWANAMEKQI